jgi:hypothetical protein
VPRRLTEIFEQSELKKAAWQVAEARTLHGALNANVRDELGIKDYFKQIHFKLP